MLATELAVAEPAVPNDTLCCLLAVLECTTDLLGRHTATHWQRDSEGCVWEERERREGRGGRAREVCTVVREPERGWWEREAEGEEVEESRYGSRDWKRERDR